MRWILLTGLALAGCANGIESTVSAVPCYARHVLVDPHTLLEDLDITPDDAVGRYAAAFDDQDGTLRTIDVRLMRPTAAFVRQVVREPTFGFEETTACDTRVGVELEIRVETGDRWFTEAFHGAAVRTSMQDQWVVRTLRPLDTLEGDYPEARKGGCENVDVGFTLLLEGGESGGRIVESQPGVPETSDDCFQEILTWDHPAQP